MILQTTSVYRRVNNAVANGYTVISAQGSSRASKTYNILIFLIHYLLTHAGVRLSIVRKTLPALKGSVLIDFKEILIKMDIYEPKSLNKSELTYTFDNGSWVEFFSCDDEQKIRGRKRDILFCNEANEISFLEWQQLKMRTTLFAILDYNPSFSDEHWLNQLNKEKGTYHFITTYKENPFLEQTIIDEIESLQYKNKSLWQVYGLGLQAVIEGLIFKDYDIVDEIPKHIKSRAIGLDFGFVNDNTAITELAVDGQDMYFDEHCYRTRMLTSDIINELKACTEWNGRHLKVVADCAEPREIQEIYRAGINIFPVKKYAGSVVAGLNKMLEYRIHITRRSTNIIHEVKNYTYLQDKEGRWLNEPIDAYNHAIDSLRYVVMSEIMGGTPKEVDLESVYNAVY